MRHLMQKNTWQILITETQPNQNLPLRSISSGCGTCASVRGCEFYGIFSEASSKVLFVELSQQRLQTLTSHPAILARWLGC